MSQLGSSLLKCPLCCEYYTERGEHVAKLLPCTHAACGKCISGIYRSFDKSLHCPICTKKHVYNYGVESISDNQYILMQIKKNEQDTCSLHQRELCLFCNGPECQKPICSLCLTNDHRAHDFDDLGKAREKKYHDLLKKLQGLRNKLGSSKEALSKLEENNAFHSKNCKAKLELDREAAIRKINENFDKLLADLDRQKMKVDEQISETMAIMDDDFLMTESIKETTSETSTCKSIAEKLETVRSMTTSHLNILSKLEACEYYEYIKTNPNSIEEACGHFVRRPLKLETERKVDLAKDVILIEDDSPVAKKRRKDKSCRKKGSSKYICTGKLIFSLTRFSHCLLIGFWCVGFLEVYSLKKSN